MSVKNKWIIKSDNRILGPYSYEQVEDLIMKRQISLIDEIRDMNNRWSYIRETQDFKHLVDLVRKELDQKNEATQTILTSTQQTSAVFNEITQSEQDDSKTAHSDINAEAVVNQKMNHEKTPKKVEGQFLYHPKVHSSYSFKKVGLLIGFIFLCVFLGWQAYDGYVENIQEKTAFQKIRRLNLYGQDQKTMDLFKALPPNSQEKIITDIIPLWLKLESMGAISYDKLIDVSTSGKIIGNEKKSQFHLFKFNKAIQLSDFGNANESLVKAIDLDPSALDVKENDATFMFFQKKYSEASKLFKKLYDQTSKGRFLYGYMISQYYAQTINFNECYKLIEDHLFQRIDFSRELLLFQMLIVKKKFPNDQHMFNIYYEKFVTFPSRMSTFFKISNLVYAEPYEWRYLKPVLDELNSDLELNQKKILEVYFLIENQNFNEAEKTLSYFKNTPSDLINNIKITLSFFRNSFSEANSIAKQTNFLSLSSHLYLLLMKKQNGLQYSEMMNHVNYLIKENSLFSNWAQLIVAQYPAERDRAKSIVQSDKLYGQEFQPYLDVKATLSD